MTGRYILDTTKTWDQTFRDLTEQFRRWSRQRNEAIPWSVANMRGNPAVTLRYVLPGEPEVTLHMDAQARDRDNLRVLFLAVEALRLNEYRGITGLIREALLALPAPMHERDPYEVLGVRPDAPLDAVQAMYHYLAKQYHPDRPGGDVTKMKELNAAAERLGLKR
jgi:DnaJ-domain-containing protein 1